MFLNDSTALPLGPLFAAVLAAATPALAQTPVPNTSTTTTPLAQSLPPNVSDWTPKERAYPGQTLVIRGSGFRPSEFVVSLGSSTLPVASGTSTEIRVTVPGQLVPAGARLAVRHSGGMTRDLEASYKVLERNATFSGASLWHVTDSTTTSIFTRGTVTLTLDLFEFGTSGSGSYREAVSLVRKANSFTESCTTNIGAPGRRDVEVWQFQSLQPSRSISWRKLADGRVELRDVGADPVTIAVTASPQAVAANFSTTAAGPFTEPTTKRYSCIGLSLSSGDVPPLQGVPYRRVEWTLSRSAATFSTASPLSTATKVP